jgi:hypothetical protein
MTHKITPTEIIDLLGGTTNAAVISGSALSTVSDWRHMKAIPMAKLILLAYPLEQSTKGVIGRKQLFPKIWPQIWPELEKK